MEVVQKVLIVLLLLVVVEVVEVPVEIVPGEKQTEILSVNGKPSEYRSLNILSAMSAFVKIFFLFYYMFFACVILNQKDWML